jgi:hypothetical protein
MYGEVFCVIAINKIFIKFNDALVITIDGNQKHSGKLNLKDDIL